MTFKFPLQRLLDLKAKREQELARQLATARMQADDERDQRDALATTHATAHAEKHRRLASTASGAPTVGELRSLAYSLDQLSERVLQADERTHAAEQVVGERHQSLSEALQERRVLDRLRDKRHDTFRAEENSRDRQTMDDIAITRFTKSSDTPNDGQDASS